MQIEKRNHYGQLTTIMLIVCMSAVSFSITYMFQLDEFTIVTFKYIFPYFWTREHCLCLHHKFWWQIYIMIIIFPVWIVRSPFTYVLFDVTEGTWYIMPLIDGWQRHQIYQGTVLKFSAIRLVGLWCGSVSPSNSSIIFLSTLMTDSVWLEQG